MIPGGYVTIGLGIALGVSLLGNAALTNAYLGQRDDAVTATATSNTNLESARLCSAGVDRLVGQAEQRAREADGQREAAEKARKAAQGRAQELLTRRPTVPGDDCKSTQIQSDDWLSSRAERKATP